MTPLDRNQPMDSAAIREGRSTAATYPWPDDAWTNDTAALAATGDPHAVDRLARHIQPMVQRYCRARIGRAAAGGYQTADDVAQEACLGIFSALPRYLGKSYPFNALAYRIAANKVADHYRRQRTDLSTPLADLPDTGSARTGPEEASLRQELNQHVHLLLDVLSDQQREILVLRVCVGMSAAETAQALGSTPGAVRVAQHRALSALRAAISPASTVPRMAGRGR